MPEFANHSCESAALTSDGHNFPIRTSICAFLDSTESSLSLEFNKMKCSTKTWAKKWAGSRIVEEQSVQVFGTFVFGTELYLKCSRLRIARAGNGLLNFYVIFIKSGIFGLSLHFSKSKYGREWLMCVITVN